MSKIELDNGKSMSERTIKTWFKLMQKEKFYYHPITSYEIFGLIPVTIIYKSKRKIIIDPNLSKIIDSFSIRDTKSFESLHLEHHLVQDNNYFGFREKVLEQSPAAFFETKSEYILYNPFHKLYDSDGSFKPQNVQFSSEDIEKLDIYLRKSFDLIDNNFLKNILLYRVNNYKSSHITWEYLKKEINIWEYVKKNKDSIGIKKVQDTLKANESILRYKLFYSPLVENLDQVFLIGSFNNKEILELARFIGPSCFSVSIFKGLRSIISLYTDINGLHKIYKFIENHSEEISLYLKNR